MNHSKSAFTMIELIFVIAIIGVVAAVGVPKLLVSRNDARASVIAIRLSNCIELAGKSYLQTSSFDINETNCNAVTAESDCFILTPIDADGVLNVKNSSSSLPACADAWVLVKKNGLSSSGSGINHFF